MSNENTIRIAGISGSLRKDSFNTLLLQASKKLLPEGVTLEILSIADLPFYNGDVDIPAVQKRPESVKVFRDKLTDSDAILFVSPEYNYSIPGVLKNAIDWASRGKDSPLLNKPVALMGATPGLWGTIRMQQAFLPIFQTLNMKPVFKPEILLAGANTKFDEKGNLIDTIAIDLISQKLQELKKLVLAHKA